MNTAVGIADSSSTLQPCKLVSEPNRASWMRFAVIMEAYEWKSRKLMTSVNPATHASTLASKIFALRLTFGA